MTAPTKTYFVPFGLSDSEAVIVCPVCGFEYIHPVGVHVNPAGAFPGSVSVTAEGIFLDKTTRPVGRGVMIELYFVCESHHRFVIKFHFCKGITYTTFRRVLPDGFGEETVWRD